MLCAEEKQKKLLEEWSKVKVGPSPTDPQKSRHSARVLQDTEPLYNRGDQMVISLAGSVLLGSWSMVSVSKSTWHRNTSFYFFLGSYFQNEKDSTTLEPWLVKEMDTCISSIYLHREVDAFVQLFNLIFNEDISGTVVHRPTHTYTQLSALKATFNSAYRQTCVLTVICKCVCVCVLSGLQAQ